VSKGWLALPAAVLLTGCVATATTGTHGPFNTSCQIAQKGIATIHVTNNGARKQNLGSFDLLLTRHNGRALKTRHIVLNPEAHIPPQGLFSNATVMREPVTYRAFTCAVTKLRP